mmetsp:Transcript_26363/g.67224  ORF Transcript_26363/g.67224 Transcript_26363/m.67224 type:complete len:225 (+) Transcript_26363:223-897(+)
MTSISLSIHTLHFLSDSLRSTLCIISCLMSCTNFSPLSKRAFNSSSLTVFRSGMTSPDSNWAFSSSIVLLISAIFLSFSLSSLILLPSSSLLVRSSSILLLASSSLLLFSTSFLLLLFSSSLLLLSSSSLLFLSTSLLLRSSSCLFISSPIALICANNPLRFIPLFSDSSSTKDSSVPEALLLEVESLSTGLKILAYSSILNRKGDLPKLMVIFSPFSRTEKLG